MQFRYIRGGCICNGKGSEPFLPAALTTYENLWFHLDRDVDPHVGFRVVLFHRQSRRLP